MTRKRSLVAAGIGLGVVVALVLWRPWSSADDAPEESPAVADSTTPTRRPANDATDLAPAFDVLADNDALGTLRLEGQVVDDAKVGVAGATVTLRSNPPRLATTEEDGSFHFDKLVSRPYRLVARSESGAAGPVTARLSETSDPVILHMRAGSSIEVTVLSAADREPVAGASVEVRGALRERATTGADGVARVAAVPSGRYQIAGWSEGRATARSFIRVGSGASTYRVELLLAAGAAVTGRVVDEGGAAVAGARVVYASVSERFNRAHPLFDAAVTGADGGFSFAALPKGTWRLSARHKTLAPGASEPIALDGSTSVSGVEIRLERGAVLRGRVETEDGAPAPHATVRAAVATRGFRGNRPRQTFADANGQFELAGLPRAPMNVVALHESATSDTEMVDTGDQSAASSLVLRLALSGRIAGRVIDSEGDPVEGAQVRLMPDFRGGASFSRAELRLRGFSTERTDAGGRFEFRGLRDDPYRLSASPPGSQQRGRGPMRGGIEVSPGDIDVEIVLEARGTIVGKVAFANGDPPGAFTVSTGGFRSAPVPFSTKDGSFELGDLEPRGYRLVIRGPGFDERSLAGIEVKAGEVADVGAVVVRQGRRVAGRVVDSGGSPVENATVVVGSRVVGSGQSSVAGSNRPFNFGGQTKETTTGGDGEFSLSGVGERSLAVVAEHPAKGRSRAISLPRTAASATGLVIALEPPGALEGRVTVNGAPGDAVRITAQSKTATGAVFAVSSAGDGRYRFDVLAPDDYLISASLGGARRGFGSVSKSVSLAPGATVDLDLVFVGGESTVMVEATGPDDGLGFGIVQIVEGEVTAKTATELDGFLAAREGGFSARAMIAGGEAAQFDELLPGAYSVCVIAFPTEVFGRSAFDYLGREGHRLELACVGIKLEGSATEKTVAVPVVVPAFVPPPSAPSQ